MLNGITNGLAGGLNGEGIGNSQVDKQNEVSKVITNPIKNPYKRIDESLLIDETAISTEAVNLYQKEQDVKQFTKLATSDPEDTSHETMVANLFSKGVLDPLSDEVIGQLAGNEKLLNDLSL